MEGPMRWSHLGALFLACALLLNFWSPAHLAPRSEAAAALLPANWLEIGFPTTDAPALLRYAGPADAAHLDPSLTGAGRLTQQDLTEAATLETRRPEVEWSAAGATQWEAVPTRHSVQVGDRIRTGTGASARLLYFEGTSTELGPDTGLLVQRLERSGEGSLITSLFQAAGTTLNRVVSLVDPGAGFQVETPAAIAMVRGTDLRVAQRTNAGAARRFLFQNETTPPGATPVEVCGSGTCRTILGGQETLATEGQGPGPVAPLGSTDQQA